MVTVIAKKCSSYDIPKVKKVIDSIFSETEFYPNLKSINSILLKPNLLGAYPPERAITTHSNFVAAVIEILKDNHIKISLMDNPGGTVSVVRAYQLTGMENLSKQYGIQLINPFRNGIYTFNKKVKYTVNKAFIDAEAIINLAKLKTHMYTLYTGAIKNFYGIIPGLAKSNLHRLAPNPTKFAEFVVDIYEIIKDKVVFNLIDGIIGMDGDGPSTGDVKKFDILLGSKNAIAVDYFASKFMGYKPEKVPITRIAAEREGLDFNEFHLSSDFDKGFVLPHCNIQATKRKNRILNLLSVPLKGFVKRFFWTIPFFEPQKCVQCQACVKFCPGKALTLEEKDRAPKIDPQKCILCMCCIEICPEHAVSLKKSFLGKMLIQEHDPSKNN
ncbi:MAG: DUF362 domain-containing protein [Candidatus Cloacimonetes bacterium]|nr:DUF362 domain-containing protein [Candidatus Cloacimonadota bacterium]